MRTSCAMIALALSVLISSSGGVIAASLWRSGGFAPASWRASPPCQPSPWPRAWIDCRPRCCGGGRSRGIGYGPRRYGALGGDRLRPSWRCRRYGSRLRSWEVPLSEGGEVHLANHGVYGGELGVLGAVAALVFDNFAPAFDGADGDAEFVAAREGIFCDFTQLRC